MSRAVLRHHAWPEVVFLLHSANRTAKELRTLTGRNREAVRYVLDRLQEEGLARLAQPRREGRHGKASDVWEWVPREQGVAS